MTPARTENRLDPSPQLKGWLTVGTLPNEDSIIRLINAVQFERIDDWPSQHRCMMVEVFCQIDIA